MFNPVSTMETRIVSTNWQVNIFSSFFPFLFLFCPPFFIRFFVQKFLRRRGSKSRDISIIFSLKKFPSPRISPNFLFQYYYMYQQRSKRLASSQQCFYFPRGRLIPFENLSTTTPLCNFHGIIRLYSSVYLPPLLPISKNFPSLAGRKVSSPRERPVFTFTS